MNNIKNQKEEILEKIKEINLDIELEDLKIKSYKFMKKSSILVVIAGVLTLMALSFIFIQSKTSFNVTHSICIIFVVSTIVLQINEIFEYKSNIRKSILALSFKNKYIDELKEKLEQLN